MADLEQQLDYYQAQQISTRAHINNYQKILDTFKDTEIKFLKVKLSPEYKQSMDLRDGVDSLDISLYALKQLLQLSDKMLRVPSDEKTKAMVDKLIS